MSVEEPSRGHEHRRDRPSPRYTRIGRADRIHRFLRFEAPACIVRVGPGLKAKLDHDLSAWCTNRRAGLQRG